MAHSERVRLITVACNASPKDAKHFFDAGALVRYHLPSVA